nr:4315_t:CDS:2 [Entrophospora candida]
MSAIPRNGALNPKTFDYELIMKHLNDQFITNLESSSWGHFLDHLSSSAD